ncbi:pyridoxal phosphate-dependent aminotransferase [Candidatus Marinamargulisbacteria bacterium SCGC AG-333-B06]|nr:pyridoxal phosphate-dependent aminotransferase [Candidatus Marinamargulisbacteria bacterium SCGC AG-333-B06]
MSIQDYLDYLKEVPKTGVIYVLEKAYEMGYLPLDDSWANLGQGAPDTESFNGTKREKKITIHGQNSEYAPVAGRIDLRKKVAGYYNTIFRKGKSSQYTYKNVCIAGGGRVALSRLVATLGHINMGHFIPDYTAYEELLSVFQNFVPIPITLEKKHHYKMPINQLKDEIVNKGLSALLISNPCNPTGQVMYGDELKQWINIAKELRCLSIYDEFYSHYIYSEKNKNPIIMSASQYIDDVNDDPAVIINGLSKNWRSPGWRIGWLLASEKIIERVASVGSFLDGGAVHALQEEALSLLNPETIITDAKEIQKIFKEKRDYTVNRLKTMGFIIDTIPEATFYVWCNITNLPKELCNGQTFFEACLKEKVITVPGIFFDVNPGRRRMKKHSRYNNYTRISFGPNMKTLKTGLDNIEKVIQKYQK